jgi:spore coat protein U-like protein
MKFSNTVKSALPAVIFGCLTLGLAPTASAGTTSGTTSFTVSVTVAQACSITPTDLVFDNYTGAEATKTSTIAVSCNVTDTAYDIGLSQGSNAGTGTYDRNMAYGTNKLSYKLYRDAGHTQDWGTAVSTDTLHVASSSTTPSVTVYGRIPANQSVAQGSYSDTITATITY